MSRASANDAKVKAGPGTVLVLMTFHVPTYEQWYYRVVNPTIQRLGYAVRLTARLQDWQTEVIERVATCDAVLIDVSFDQVGSLSENVVWELSEIFRLVRRRAVSRDKVLCAARGLHGVPARDDDENYVYAIDVCRSWLSLAQRSLNMDDLLGFRIRRYDPNSPPGIQCYQEWLTEALRSRVQAPPTILPGEVRLRAQMLAEATHDPSVAMWAKLVAVRDVRACARRVADSAIPPEVRELLACFIVTINVADAFRIRGYWTLVKRVLPPSPLLLCHYLFLLEDPIARCYERTPGLNNFRENLWHAFAELASVPLAQHAIERLRSVSEREPEPTIKLVARSAMIKFLPEAEQKRARLRMIEEFHMEHP